MTVCSKNLMPPEPKLFRHQKSSIQSVVIDSYLRYRRHLLSIIVLILSYSLLRKIRKPFRELPFEPDTTNVGRSSRRSRKKTMAPNNEIIAERNFVRDLRYLLKIIIPSWRTREIRLIITHSGFLLIRTFLSLYVANLDGKLVSSLVRGQGKLFLTSLIWWMVVAIPATFTNSIVR